MELVIHTNHFKDTNDVLKKGNYHELKLLNHITKLVEHIFDFIIKCRPNIDNKQLNSNTTDAICIYFYPASEARKIP